LGTITLIHVKIFKVNIYSHSRSDSFWVSWEQGRLSNVVEVAVKLNNSLKTETSATVSWGSVFKCINIILNGINWDVEKLGSLSKHFRIVDSLGTTCDFFSSHEEII